MARYKQVGPGEWQQPVRRGYKMGCCDCGLVHRIDFRILVRNSRGARTVQFRAFRDERATAAVRRGLKRKK